MPFYPYHLCFTHPCALPKHHCTHLRNVFGGQYRGCPRTSPALQQAVHLVAKACTPAVPSAVTGGGATNVSLGHVLHEPILSSWQPAVCGGGQGAVLQFVHPSVFGMEVRGWADNGDRLVHWCVMAYVECGCVRGGREEGACTHECVRECVVYRDTKFVS
jgi:hypothetical protein